MNRKDILNREEEIRKWVNENRSNAFICKQLKCKPSTLNSYYKKMGIEYKGNQSGKGFKHCDKRKTALDYLNSSDIIKSPILRKKLIEDGFKEDKCEICGLSEWQGIKLPLELHHKDGDHYNNNLDNIIILCPNCHSIQHNHGTGEIIKNKKKLKKTLIEEEKYNLFKQNGQIRNDNHICPQKYSYEQIEQRKNLVLNSNIDFSKWGWGTKLSKVLGISSQKTIEWVKNNMPNFYLEKCYKPNSYIKNASVSELA